MKDSNNVMAVNFSKERRPIPDEIDRLVGIEKRDSLRLANLARRI